MLLNFALSCWLASVAVAGVTAADPSAWCSADRYEPNDERRRARPLVGLARAHLCVGEDDWYVVEARRGDRLWLHFEGGAAQVGLTAFAPRRRKHAARVRGRGSVRLRWTARHDGRYRVRLRHRAGPPTSYTLDRPLKTARGRPRRAGE